MGLRAKGLGSADLHVTYSESHHLPLSIWEDGDSSPPVTGQVNEMMRVSVP